MTFDNNENKNKKLNNEKLKFYNLLDENNLVKLPLKNPKNPNYIRNNTFIKLKQEITISISLKGKHNFVARDP